MLVVDVDVQQAIASVRVVSGPESYRLVWSDEDVPLRKRSRLTPRQRRLVGRAALSGQCHCQFCEKLRAHDLKLDQQRVLDRCGDPDAAQAAWTLIETDPLGRQLAQAAYRSISSWRPVDWTFVQVDDPLDELLLYLERRAARPPADLLTCMLFDRGGVAPGHDAS